MEADTIGRADPPNGTNGDEREKYEREAFENMSEDHDVPGNDLNE